MAIIEDVTSHEVAKVGTAPNVAATSKGLAVTIVESHQPCSTAPVEISITDGNSTQSAALPVGIYIITANLDVAFAVGANPTATSANSKLWSKTYRWLQITTASDKVAAIRLNSDTGTVSIEQQQ